MPLTCEGRSAARGERTNQQRLRQSPHVARKSAAGMHQPRVRAITKLKPSFGSQLLAVQLLSLALPTFLGWGGHFFVVGDIFGCSDAVARCLMVRVCDIAWRMPFDAAAEGTQ